MIHFNALTLLAFLAFLSPTQGFTHETAPWLLEPGEQRWMSFPKIIRFSVSGSAIRHTRRQNQILIKAVKPGISQLDVLVPGPKKAPPQVWTRTVRVETKTLQPQQRDLALSLSQLETLEVIRMGARFAIRGTVSSYREAQVLQELRQTFPQAIIESTELEPSWAQKSKAQIQEVLKPFKKVKLTSLKSGFRIEGPVPHASVAADLERRIRALQPLSEFAWITFKSDHPTLYFKTYILEIKRTWMRKIGIEWPTQHPMTLQLPSFDFDGIQYQGATQLGSTLHAMSQRGHAKILSSPELVVRCPGQAELFAGGELPIRQTSRFNDQVIWKSFGLGLKIQAQEASSERVRLNIETEISHLDQDLKNDNIPGVQSNRIKTQVDATLGRPLLLSGLLQEDIRNRSRGVAGLSDLPVLGALFRSEDFLNDRSELVAILVPSAEPPQEPIQRLEMRLPKGFLPVPLATSSAEQLQKVLDSPDYPWSAFE